MEWAVSQGCPSGDRGRAVGDHVRRFVPAAVLIGIFALSLTFVPFRYRTLVTTEQGGFDFQEERVWAPVWDQPVRAAGVAEDPFRWLLGLWGGLTVVGVAVWVTGRRRRRRDEVHP